VAKAADSQPAEPALAPYAAPDLLTEINRWLTQLRTERRLSPKTLEAYERDVRQFMVFLGEHWDSALTLKRFAKLEATDVRAFMAARRSDEIAGRSLMRALAGLRSLARFLEREGKGKVGALSAIRAPKVGKSLPKPLQMATAKRIVDADLRAGEDREPWILARDAAVLALLYGSGLRISEALGLKHRDVPAPGAGDVLVVTGKGNKTRMVPVLQNVLALIADYVAICPHALPPERPIFVGAKGGPLSPRIIQLAMASLRGALGLPDSATPHALRHSFATHLLSRGRRSQGNPGIAGTRLIVDHADLYRHRCRTTDGRLQDRPSPCMTPP
jgi:integrase/recombinase XerC